MTVRASICRLGPLFAIAAVLAVTAVLVNGRSVSAAQATIDGGTWHFAAASTGNAVQIKFSGIPAAGLGASDISVAFNPAVLKITSCGTGGLDGACNPNAPGGPARAAGFKAPAITTGPVVIAALTFDCVGAAAASSAVTITVNELLDGAPGQPQPISASVQNGTVVCGEAAASPPLAPAQTPTPAVLPPTGGSVGDSSGAGTGWIIAVAAALAIGALGLGIFGARRWRSRT
jgi:hypothetical protein